jgi:sugar-specific transcriptional regulator TrmB
LTRLGLTQYQGRVFLILAELGIATAKDVTKQSGVPRPKVYEALDALQEMGLVNKVMTAPATFETIPLKNAFSFLLKKKLKDYHNLRSETSSIMNDFDQKHRDIPKSRAPKVALISDKEAIVSCIKRLVENAKDSIDLVTSWKRFSQITIFSNALLKAKSSGARMRVVVQEPKNRDFISGIISSIGMPNSEYRTISFAPSAITWLCDGQEVLICTEAKTGVRDSPGILSDNSCLVEVAKAYFQQMWLSGQLYTEYVKKGSSPSPIR